MALSSSEQTLIDELNIIYETEWRPACNMLHASIPKKDDEFSVPWAMRAALRAMSDPSFDVGVMSSVMIAGTKWLQRFKTFHAHYEKTSSYLGPTGAGYCRAMNIWQVIFPMAVHRHCRLKRIPYPMDTLTCFLTACPSDEFTLLWDEVLMPAAQRDARPFPDEDIRHLIANSGLLSVGAIHAH